MTQRAGPALAFALVPALAAGLPGCPADETAKPPTTKSSPASAPASAPTSTTASRGTTPATRDQVDPDGVVRRGARIAHDQAMPVAAVLKDLDALNGKTVTVTGEVTQVCAKKGCWMAIRGETGGPAIRVTMKDYGWFVPATSEGMTATVKGALSVKVLDEATLRHYAEDATEAGESPPAVEAGAPEIALVSVGLELRN